MTELTYREAIRQALIEEMQRDESVFLLGEDIGKYGGACRVTAGLLEEFGQDRVMDTPIAEAGIIGLALGAEDYKFSLSEFGMVSEEMVDFARKIIIQYSKAHGILSIDTVFRDYNNTRGLQDELKKIKGMGFSSKLAIHPGQIEIINSSFTPSAEEINKAEIILKHKDELKKMEP